MRNPRETEVVVVGIAEYHAGAKWALHGPAEDALRFVRFFLDHKVPPANITLLLSPTPPAEAVPGGVRCRPADRGSVRDVFMRALPGSRHGSLCVVWGGHGFVDNARRRRLLVADAVEPDPVDLDLDSLLATYGSQLVPNLHRQLWIVDACQVNDAGGVPLVRGHETFPVGAAAPGRDQSVIIAAAPGQMAVNLSKARTGVFSRETLRLLNSVGPALLDDPERLHRSLRERFAGLAESGLAEQTPSYLWYRDASGNEQLLLDGGRAAAPPAAKVPLPVLRPVIEALVAIPEFLNPTLREEILLQLPRVVHGTLPRHYTHPRADATGIVRRCYEGGSLRDLVDAVRHFLGDTDDVRRLERAAAALPGWPSD